MGGIVGRDARLVPARSISLHPRPVFPLATVLERVAWGMSTETAEYPDYSLAAELRGIYLTRAKDRIQGGR